MPKISTELMEMLSSFLINEIESRALSGITYTMLFNNDQKEKEKYDEYMKIIQEVQNCGYKPEEVFRAYQVSNGYIFDMDLSVAKYVTTKLSEVVNKGNGGQTPVGDLIGRAPEKRRQEDMMKLAKLVKSEFQAGNKRIEVALFSRNSVPRIVINAEDKKGNPALLKYNAFAIRHWDLEAINTQMLRPEGIHIVKIEPCEILPPKTGVRFILDVAKIA